MKPMRVLNCTKMQREAIFAIANEVGLPVMSPDTFLDGTRIKSNPHIGFDGAEIRGLLDYECNNAVSFSEFITELLKYEKPKVWLKQELVPMTNIEVEIESSPIAWCYIPKNSRNHKFTYEVQEETE